MATMPQRSPDLLLLNIMAGSNGLEQSRHAFISGPLILLDPFKVTRVQPPVCIGISNREIFGEFRVVAEMLSL
ncbi:MAG: hypothetical protein JO033_00930 [Acidobacteriaceae bacterium]|nr:hypothetical protein [Acidobacteriaceae bacterium]